MRTFFALALNPADQQAIAAWRDRLSMPSARPVPAENFHITLAFLGDITPPHLDRLCTAADRLTAAAIALHLDTPGYFPAAGIHWIGCSAPPAALTTLAAQLRHAARRVGIPVSHKRFEPHVTLFRRCHSRPPLTPPDFHLTCDGFTLFESITDHRGTRYHPLRQWEAPLPQGAKYPIR